MTLTVRQIGEIRDLLQGRILTDVPLSRFTSFRIGGPADLVAEPATVQELTRLIRYLAGECVPHMLLGAGTNVLFHDRGYRGVVVRTGAIDGFEVAENGSEYALVTVAAGVPLASVVSRTSKLGWQGLESLWGIPGSFGGAVATNAGAGQSCVGECLVGMNLITDRGEEVSLQQNAICYEYRSMAIPPKHVIAGGTLRLKRGAPDAIQEQLAAARARRQGKQPWDKPSAGCVFKNPSPDKHAGALIDRLGLKGMTIGDAQVSEVHANFIINRGSATASDVLELIRLVRGRVREEEGLELELEIHVFDEEAARD
jgi:UDP-N-acetylmuramate dehydrogenase